MRTIAAVIFSLIAFATARPASADPCPVRLNFVVRVPSAPVYAIGLTSDETGEAHLDAALFGAGVRYDATFARVDFTDSKRVAADGAPAWASPTLYVRVPADAPPLEAATLAIEDPDTHVPLDCTGGHAVAADLGRDAPRIRANEKPARAAAVDRAIAAYDATSAVVTGTAVTEPRLTCAKPYLPARTANVVQPAYPLIARQNGHVGSVSIDIELGTAGEKRSAVIRSSSGWPELDAAARAAALATTYVPETFRCAPVAGTYEFRAGFASR